MPSNYQNEADFNKRLDQLLKERNELEKNPIIIEYKKFLNKTPWEQQREIDLWNKYYLNCRETPSHAIYYEAREAIRTNNMARLRSLVSDAQQMLSEGINNTITEPDCYDPNVFIYQGTARQYDSVLRNIAWMQEKLNGQNLEVWQ